MTTTIPARPTIYKGVRMRSRLEAKVAETLDWYRFPWRYEPQCFASELGQYLPDFQLFDTDVYLEVKPQLSDNPYPLKDPRSYWSLTNKYRDIILASKPQATFLFWAVDSSTTNGVARGGYMTVCYAGRTCISTEPGSVLWGLAAFPR